MFIKVSLIINLFSFIVPPELIGKERLEESIDEVKSSVKSSTALIKSHKHNHKHQPKFPGFSPEKFRHRGK